MYLAETVTYYDDIYSRIKNYSEEAEKVLEWIRRYRPQAKTLLDLACGTAEHTKHLKKHFAIDGLDLSADFLKIASHKNPDCTFHQANMIDFRLDKKFDVIISLFSSIGYVQTKENLRLAIDSMRYHLNPGGMILLEPWLTPENWNPGRPFLLTVDEPELKVSRMNTTETRNGISYFKWHFLVAKPEPIGVKYFTEEHTLGLFSIDDMKEAFVQAGLRVSHDPVGIFGRGLYVAE